MSEKPNHDIQKPKKDSLILKFILSLLVLIVLLVVINTLVTERASALYFAKDFLSENWGDRPVIGTPSLYTIKKFTETTTLLSSKSEQKLEEIIYDYREAMPEKVVFHTKLHTQEKERGLYLLPAFVANTKVSVDFVVPSTDTEPFVDTAFLFLGIGAESLVSIDNIKINDKILSNKDINIILQSRNTMISKYKKLVEMLPDTAVILPISLNEYPAGSTLAISFMLETRGISGIQITAMSKQANIEIRSDYSTPDMLENILPHKLLLNDNGSFIASWEYNSAYPRESNVHLSYADGDSLYSDIGSMIWLAFLPFFLIFICFLFFEQKEGKEVLWLHYILYCLSLALYYLQMLSFGEFWGYEIAYSISTMYIVFISGWYTMGILGRKQYGIMVSVLSSVLYLIIYLLTKEGKYTLLIGTILLTIIVALSMWWSIRMNKASIQ